VIDVSEPCRERWDRMDGDDFVRFCGVCEKNVYDLSARRRDEAEELLRVFEGPICVRFRRRADGTVATADCRGARRAHYRRAAGRAGRVLGIVAAASAGVLATLGVFAAMLPPSRGERAKTPDPHVRVPHSPNAGPSTSPVGHEPEMIMGLMAAPAAWASPAWVDPSELHSGQ
jgi:hypothetical protein